MSEFSSSGIYQFPVLTADALGGRTDSRYRQAVLDWLQQAVLEGDQINQSDLNYDFIEKGMRYVGGDQHPSRDQPRLPQYLQPMVFNVSRKAMQAHVSTLTDVKPTFGWKSLNPKYAMVAQQLNLLSVAWWLNRAADLRFGDVIKLAWACGTGDLGIEWNPGLSGGGDHDVIPKDPRDTLPWRPTRYGDEQTWQGVTFREIWSVNAMREKFPGMAPYIQSTEDSLLSSVKGLFFRKAATLQTPMDPLAVLGGAAPRQGPARQGDSVLYRTYLDDRTRNMTNRPIVMGQASHGGFVYTVEPQGYLYPYKRLIVSTPDLILYDGPNPYMHGMFPFARLHLWKLPWNFLGQSALADLAPVQDAINLSAQHMKMGIEQWMDRQTVVGRQAVSAATAQAYDAKKPGFQFRLRTDVVDPTKVVHKLDGPNPQVMSQNFEWFGALQSVFENLSGTANLQALLQLRQMPSADTIRTYYEAMTPELRMEGRMFEAFLRRAAPQIAFNTFQFMTSARRIAILGDAGTLLEDFDFEPDSLVPALQPTVEGMDPGTGLPGLIPNPQYDPMFDAQQPRSVRAQRIAQMMVFVVAPNSVLAFNAQEDKMLKLQLARQGYYDMWSLAEALEIPNFGPPPTIPLPPLQPPPVNMGDPLQVIAFLQSNPGKYILDPASGQILELRPPITVTERLQAQMLLGIGMTEGTTGRKASGQAPPKQETKKDESGGERSTITESEK